MTTNTGADDNVSGVAGLIELARLLAASRLKSNNYLFVVFSGEEEDLYGSKYLVDHSPIDLKRLNYMINLDMIGQLNDSSHVLTLGGFGTSPAWGEVCNATKEKKAFTIRVDSSGTGPDDHTSFYWKDVPALFVFTPGASPDRVNYLGELEVIKFIYGLIEAADKRGRFAFVKRE